MSASKSKALDVPIDQSAILRHLGLDANDPAAQALVLTCQRYNLDPILRHMLLIEGRPYVTRDGLLHVAHVNGQLDGIEVLEQSETETHFIAKVAVYRKDMSHPFTFVGRFPKMRATYEWKTASSGKRYKAKGGEEPHPYGPEMAVKCAEVMGLRRAFDVSLAAQEERWDIADHDEQVPAPVEAKVVDQPKAIEESSGASSTRAVPDARTTEPTDAAHASPQKVASGSPHTVGGGTGEVAGSTESAAPTADANVEGGSADTSRAASSSDSQAPPDFDPADLIDQALETGIVRLTDVLRVTVGVCANHDITTPPGNRVQVLALDGYLLVEVVHKLNLLERMGLLAS